MNNQKQKKILIVVATFILVLAVTGISIAFFNYTRTGAANTFQTGRIYFSTGQSNTINLTNVFPIASGDLSTDVGNHGTVTVTLVGDTEYTGGIEYLVTLDQVNNTVNNKKIPIKFSVTATNIGTSSNDYWNARGGNSSIYELTESGYVKEDKYVLVGYIASGQTGINGNIQISAYLDADKIAISDTYNGEETDNMGTTTDWVNGRVVFTTTEWNTFRTTPISFKVRVEANEGIWVEKWTTPASCFTTISATYTRNPSMSVNTCLSTLTGLGKNDLLQSGETLETFCNGTGTLNGGTFQEWLDDNEFSSSNLISLESAGIITATGSSVAISNYDANCGSDVVIPSTINGYTVIEVGERAFNGKNLTNVELPDTLRLIGSGAFFDNWLSGSIEIPASVTNVYEGAFSQNSLTQLIVSDTLYTMLAGSCNNSTFTIDIADEGAELINKSGTMSCSILPEVVA